MDNATITFLEEICRNASLSKYRHFFAASRNKLLNIALGIPVVVVNVLLGSVLFWALSEDLSMIMKWGGAFLALGAALCSGIQTFFNFNRQFEGHRTIANRYLRIAYECQHLLYKFQDNLITLEKLSQQLDDIQYKYNKINEDAELYSTTESDYKKALLKEIDRKEGIGERCNLSNNNAEIAQ
ncbi:MAG: SLATT domain-containing protein [Desulfotalea sp.]